MKTFSLVMLTLAAGMTARADFSYSTTMKMSGGMAAGMAGMNDRATQHSFKGNKMKMDMGDTATILDFDAQTFTTIDNKKKTYTVMSFNDLGAMTGDALKQSGAEISVDVKETGQQKNINGYNAKEVVMSMDIDNPQARQAGMKMRMEMDMWISPDVPGAGELRAFYQRNAERFPWGAMSGGAGRGGQGMQKGMAELQRKMASMNGVPVLQVVRMKSAGNEGQMAQAQQQMAKACAQFEEMKAKGGQQAAMAEQMMARMNCKPGGGGGSGSLFETTMESSGFSANAIPDSAFAIPSGYQQVSRK
jgi:hypothetical protein